MLTNHSSELPQRMAPWLLSAYLVLLNTFIPLSTDMYLSGLPSMGTEFGASSGWINLTLSSFFLFYAVGTLVLGPISDKLGRRPVLLGALVTYIISSVGCALAPSVGWLILARIVQGLGAGGVLSVAMAVIKDSYQGARRESALALTQTMGGLAPILAPVLGAWILVFSGWRTTFYVLAGVGLIALALTWYFRESLGKNERYQGSMVQALANLGTVFRNRSVLYPVLIFSLGVAPFLGYISISSYIYVDQFHLTRQEYSYFFAANAIISLFGPLLYVRLASRFDRRWVAFGIFGLTLLAGIGVWLVGPWSPFWFLGSFAVVSLVTTGSRPLSTNMVFDQHAGDAGAVSSVLGTSTTVMGSLGMVVASLPNDHRVEYLGLLIGVSALVSMVGWALLLKSSVPLAGVKPRG